jgi:hypothetical protein
MFWASFHDRELADVCTHPRGVHVEDIDPESDVHAVPGDEVPWLLSVIEPGGMLDRLHQMAAYCVNPYRAFVGKVGEIDETVPAADT